MRRYDLATLPVPEHLKGIDRHAYYRRSRHAAPWGSVAHLEALTTSSTTMRLRRRLRRASARSL
jgi:hypothetical protein